VEFQILFKKENLDEHEQQQRGRQKQINKAKYHKDDEQCLICTHKNLLGTRRFSLDDLRQRVLAIFRNSLSRCEIAAK
jgi:hypothetical protein